MPAYNRIDVENGVIYSVYSGTVTADEVRGAIASARADPRVRPEFRTLVDCGAVASIELRFEETAALAEFSATHASPQMTGRVAFYVPQRNAVYGALRQFQALSKSPDRVEIFTDRNAARAWIGLPPE
jgi:hypothetical protein